MLARKLHTKLIPSPIQVPIGPKNIRVTGRVITRVSTGIRKYCNRFGMTFFKNVCTCPINHTASIIGINVLE